MPWENLPAGAADQGRSAGMQVLAVAFSATVNK